MATELDPYAELRNLALEERVKAVSEDVRSGRDRFCCADVHGLAELLGLDAYFLDGNWFRRNVVPPVDLEEVAEYSGEIEQGWVDQLEAHVSPERIRELIQASEAAEPFGFDVNIFSLLDRKFVIDRIAQQRMGSDGFCIALAHACVEAASGETLAFEARIEDDGTCVGLLGPYDDRDDLLQSDEGCLVEDF